MLWFRCRSRSHGDLWKCGVEGTVIKLFQQDWGLRGLRWCNWELHLRGHQNCCRQLWISWDVDRLFDHKPYIWGSDAVVGAVYGKAPGSCWTLPKQPPWSDGVLGVHQHRCWTLSKQSPCFDVCVHANKAISHKEIEFKTTACKTRMCNEQFNKCFLSGLMISCWLCRKDSVKPSCILHKKLYGCGVLSADLACICASTQVGDCLVVRLPLLLFCSFFLSLYSYTTRNPNWADHIPSKNSLMPPFWTPAKVFSFRLPKNQTLRDSSSWQVQWQREIAWLGLLDMLKSSQTNDEQQSEQRETALTGFLYMLSSSKTNDEQQAFASIQTSQTFLIWHTKYKVIYQ